MLRLLGEVMSHPALWFVTVLVSLFLAFKAYPPSTATLVPSKSTVPDSAKLVTISPAPSSVSAPAPVPAQVPDSLEQERQAQEQRKMQILTARGIDPATQGSDNHSD